MLCMHVDLTLQTENKSPQNCFINRLVTGFFETLNILSTCSMIVKRPVAKMLHTYHLNKQTFTTSTGYNSQ